MVRRLWYYCSAPVTEIDLNAANSYDVWPYDVIEKRNRQNSTKSTRKLHCSGMDEDAHGRGSSSATDDCLSRSCDVGFARVLPLVLRTFLIAVQNATQEGG